MLRRRFLSPNTMLLHFRSESMPILQRWGATYFCSGVFVLVALWATQQQFAANPGSGGSRQLRFEISFPATVNSKALDGHIMLGIAKDEKPEPRYQLKEEEAESAQFFGLDVDALAPDTSATIDSSTLGYPIVKLDALPAGDYYVQAVLNVYETFHRADGHTVKLPPDMGAGPHWFDKPGNLFSTSPKLHIDPAAGAAV